MGITIIKAGDVDKRRNKEFHFKCKHCSCEWGADRKDVKFTPPRIDYDVYMQCPNCKTTVYLYS